MKRTGVKRFVWSPLVLISSVLISSVLIPSGAFAHPVDTVVQAAYLTLAATHLNLELDLTPGDVVANQFVGFLDQNNDGQIGEAEINGFADRVLKDLSVRINNQAVALHLESKTVPKPAELRTGGQQVKLIFAANIPDASGTNHLEHSLEFRNTLEFQSSLAPIRNAYLANVFVQSGEVKILDQKRDATQQDFRVRYSLEPRAPRFDWAWLIPVILAPTVIVGWWLTRTKRRPRELA